ncbi:PREDICTED: protein asteroid-like isoform X3 [Trachymyrmex septentrionalis]|uniref:protein asteroid-like isoform X3 n=1 Tax=Trachymyrmex septentrionalis TaxID=34720 RepID=UPI00084F0CFB|nr:PREDICTED: protein asteroid-like isoform X3 [Trachymyrmex septentrionalis]
MASTKIEFAVHMTCEKCVNAISKSIADIEDIQNVDISLERGTVTLETNLPYSIIQERIERTGRQAVLKGYGDGPSAVVMLGGNSGYSIGNLIRGVIRFAETSEGCIIDGTIDGLTPGEHGIHVHECGDISNGCERVGEHFNPNNSPHGSPENDLSKRHVGDLGNVLADTSGRAAFRKIDKFLKIPDIIGRSLIITKDPDDLGRGNSPESKINGNSGARLACGIIARSSGLFQNTKKICACDGLTIWDERDRALVNNHERYLEYYALHDTYLVIDGNSVCCQLYIWYARCNCAFGGDYDKYAQYVKDFFDKLLRCNVTPLVLIDGGCEDKKLKTVISRTKQKIEIASNYTLSSQHRTKFLPLLMREVFKDIMKEKGIRYAQCIFEADNTIAMIARILNCPVLSYDSDFYIYGSLYIPFNTLETDIVPNPTGRGYINRCKIYYVNKLFQVYYGLNQSLLPLAAVLLGNDYVKQHKFKNFFRHLPRSGRRRYNNEQQRRIDMTFDWLRRRSLNEAVIGILRRLRKQERKHVLNTIETVINSYTNAPLSVLNTLSIPAESFSRANMQNMPKIYKFEGDIYNLTFIDERINDTELSDGEEIEDREITDILEEKKLISNESLVDNLPQWFINEFKQSRFPSYFIDLIIRKLYVCPAQIEDSFCISSIVVSLKIIGVIYGLLISGVQGRKSNMEYITRDENKKIKRYQLEYSDNILGCKLPPLLNLREVSIVIRREILNSTLTIFNAKYINEIPSIWMLYIATMKYWIDQQEEPSKFNCHVYSLLFALLFNLIDCNIGFYRILNKFCQRFNRTVDNIRHERKMENYQPQYSIDATLADAIREVDANDCLIAAAFFISNFEVDQKLHLQPKKFNITIVHGFAEFQNCLRHSMNLNALLGYPYEPTRVASVFNGTLLYNLCSNFKKRDNIEAYINLILQDSPSLSRLFNILLLKVKPLFNTALENKADKYKKQKVKRYEKKKCISHEENHEENPPQESTSEEFYDVNNSFSVLGTTQH